LRSSVRNARDRFRRRIKGMAGNYGKYDPNSMSLAAKAIDAYFADPGVSAA
jgi:hypothetical protein